MGLKQNTWKLNQWYDQDVAGNVSYSGARTLWMTGRNDEGYMGVNQPDNYARSSPVQVPGTTWSSLISAQAGDGTTGAFKTDGTMWVWGRNEAGELGQNNVTYYSSPVQVGTDTTWSTGNNAHYCTNTAGGCFAIKTDGTLWSWGGNNSGSLGHNIGGNPGHCSSPTQIGAEATWSAIDGGNGMHAIKTDGTLWAWGGNDRGQLGLNAAGDNAARSSPIQIGSDTTWRTCSTGTKSVLLSKTDGTLWAMGAGTYGQLAQNNETQYSSPVQIPGTTWSSVNSAAYATFVALKTDGTLWSWGYNQSGALGQNEQYNPGTRYGYSSPVQIPGTDWVDVKSSHRGLQLIKNV